MPSFTRAQVRGVTLHAHCHANELPAVLAHAYCLLMLADKWDPATAATNGADKRRSPTEGQLRVRCMVWSARCIAVHAWSM